MRTMTALAAGIVLGTAGFLGAQAPVTPVAFVGINRVFQSYSVAKARDNDINLELEKLNSWFTQREQEINKARSDIEAKYDAGTKEYDSARRDIDLQIAGLKFDAKSAGDNLMRKKVTVMAALYREICAVAQGVAEEKGYSFVFNIDTDPIKVEDKGQFLTLTELKLQMAFRTGVWAKAENDITKDVIEALEKAK